MCKPRRPLRSLRELRTAPGGPAAAPRRGGRPRPRVGPHSRTEGTGAVRTGRAPLFLEFTPDPTYLPWPPTWGRRCIWNMTHLLHSMKEGTFSSAFPSSASFCERRPQGPQFGPLAPKGLAPRGQEEPGAPEGDRAQGGDPDGRGPGAEVPPALPLAGAQMGCSRPPGRAVG